MKFPKSDLPLQTTNKPLDIEARWFDLDADWAATLTQTVNKVSSAWGLSDFEKPYDSATCSWVAPCIYKGVRVVLKIGWPHMEARDEHVALRFGHSCFASLIHYDPDSGAMLIEQIDGPNASSLPEAEQHEIVGGLLRKMRTIPTAGLRSLDDMLGDWSMSIDVRRKVDSLLRTCEERTFLATDLHAKNILLSNSGPIAIDPKPFVGDPAFDVTQHLLNSKTTISDPNHTVETVCRFAGVDLERAKEWLAIRLLIGD